MATSLRISIPQPCAQPWAAMTPTTDGRHCAACATEVVDFTRMSDAEIMTYLARQSGRPVCALARVPQLVAAPASRWRRWALAGLALLGWQPITFCTTKPPQELPAQATAASATNPDASQSQQIIIRGRVLDGDTKTAVAQVNIFLNGTQYGTVTDEQGQFELMMSPSWAPIAGGTVELRFVGNPFDFVEKILSVNTRSTPQPEPLVVRMESVPNRGQVMGKIRMPEPPVTPPRQ
ncbi:carboxypeptidase-like regulatory domain-containing protein [Hymenobacter arizonensis]|uniref:CarboxypepD_reg-like domain-containing protein n=1 Tax=Hymenobacter arizonensis TaxID=1227077 RepID=A0A1I6B726_HYMAR|nr:carboxypeptidase-like regulatory domain-containing protein [Hymenobacter arizonensis]SFQ76735.1 CarboxypepD_reg-like domain-containing protein [Hymenobacter arizonensis]